LTEIESKLKPLMLAALSGDDASYAALLTLLTRLLRAYFRKRMGANLDEVEDVIQEVLIAIHNQRHTFDAAYPVSAWAHGIARFKLLDFYRRHKQYVADHVDIDDAEDLMVAEDSDAHSCSRPCPRSSGTRSIV
jgi:RNA polymerase sigma-70 factor, ECF subfamily